MIRVTGNLFSEAHGRSEEGMLKPLGELCDPDKRHMPGGPFAAVINNRIENLHADMAPLELNNEVPDDVRSQFDTARHAFIYSWYCYELITLAEQQAYSALENALRLRIKCAKVEFKGIGLDAMFACAFKHGFLSKSDFDIPGGANLLEVVRISRNHISHGEAQLSLHFSLEMIRLCAKILNKLFSAKGDLKHACVNGFTKLHHAG